MNIVAVFFKKVTFVSAACYKVPSNLQIKIVKMQWLTFGEWGCPPDNDPKLAVGQPNSS